MDLTSALGADMSVAVDPYISSVLRPRPSFLASVGLCLLAVGCSASGVSVDSRTAWNQLTSSPTEAQSREYSRILTRCMKQKGWTFTAPTMAALMPLPPATVSKEKVKRWGFFMTTALNHSEEFKTDNPERQGETDPNAGYIGSLSTSERRKYFMDLDGTDASDRGAFSVSGGCQRAAAASILGENSVQFNPSVMLRWSKLEDETEKAPEVVAANLEYQGCMKKLGFDVTSKANAQQKIGDQLTKLNGIQDQGARAKGVKALQDAERSIALASFDCEPVVSQARSVALARLRAEFKQREGF
jgi:hypothetical protein